MPYPGGLSQLHLINSVASPAPEQVLGLPEGHRGAQYFGISNAHEFSCQVPAFPANQFLYVRFHHQS